MKNLLIHCAEQAWLPDAVIRAGIRGLHRGRLKSEQRAWSSRREETLKRFAEALERQPIAVHTDDANEQHYEVPTEFFRLVLGPRMKYSSCLFDTARERLNVAEERMLALTCERAQLRDGEDILELGCGWGSLSLYMAECYPHANIVAVSNSSTQKAYIDGVAAQCGLSNLTVETADVATFQPGREFDRIVSVEMFEHMRNYQQLFERIETWLRPEGCLFVHVFCHRDFAYLFEEQSEADWMTHYFFRGGTMPSYQLLPLFRGRMTTEAQWKVNGLHYSRTLEAWLKRLDAHRDDILKIFSGAYGAAAHRQWLQRWRIFLMACSELFRFGNGEEWFVAHYRFAKGS